MTATAVDLDLELLQGSIRDRLRSALRYAVLAPSTHNTQPWLFRLDDESVEIYADRTRALPHIDPDHRELTMSVGAALEHLRIALVSHLMEPEIELLPDLRRPDLLARVTCLDESRPAALDHLLFTQIRHRHTVRGPMRPDPIPETVLSELERSVNDRNAGVLFVGEGELRERVAQMVRKGDETLLSEPQYRKEFVEWIAGAARPMDGVPASALCLTGVPGLPAWSYDHLVSPKAAAEQDVARMQEASALAIVCSRGDDPSDWLAVGMAIARLTLCAASKGVRCSYFLQPVQLPACRRELKEATRAFGFPQIVLRLGYAEEGEPTPRRPLEDVLVERRQSRGGVSKGAAPAASEPTGGRTQ